ncbi:hypothetical protein AY601_1612 [Pedobacter cryoconitis]|uniref:Uncharacterized protein n=1 Tax=Pedobacter cryoconitis TaxID=188932 RepID=A0A127VBC6_9SPHI|nr:hypothetical protein AY601_1612 [Pedobacter cryoconitis]
MIQLFKSIETERFFLTGNRNQINYINRTNTLNYSQLFFMKNRVKDHHVNDSKTRRYY